MRHSKRAHQLFWSIRNTNHPNDSKWNWVFRWTLQTSQSHMKYYHQPFEFKLWSSICSFSTLAGPSNTITRRGKNNYLINSPCLNKQSAYWEPRRIQSTYINRRNKWSLVCLLTCWENNFLKYFTKFNRNFVKITLTLFICLEKKSLNETESIN